MLDRRTIKRDVKGILGGESRGAVFLAVLLTFIVLIVYFGGVWALGQFYPVTQADIDAIVAWYQQPIAYETAGAVNPAGTANALGGVSLGGFMQGLSTLGRTLTNIGMIYLIAFVLELIIVLPLMTGVRKFMLRVIRLKNPSAGTVFKGYTGSYFFRSIILPFWQGLCLLGWQIIMLILLVGGLAGTALATGLSTQDFAALSSGVSMESISAVFTAEYIARCGWIYAAVLCAWYVLDIWLIIFKCISYSMAPVALAERPQMGVRKAVRASRRIVRGNHFALLVVSLSFLGWYILAGLAFGLVVALGVGMNALNMGQLGLIITLGVLVVAALLIMYLLMPYRVGVHSMCYVMLKREALENGIVDKEDFRGKRELMNAAGE